MKLVLNRAYGGFALSEEQAKAYGVPEEDMFDGFGGKVYYNYDLERTDPKLIEVIELGLENAWASSLDVVEIPDGVHYKIQEYDGWEYLIWSESEIHFV